MEPMALTSKSLLSKRAPAVVGWAPASIAAAAAVEFRRRSWGGGGEDGHGRGQ